RRIVNHALTDALTEYHHPCRAAGCIACSMVLKAVAAGIKVRIASEIRQHKHCRVAGIFRFCLYRLPQLRAEPVCSPDSVDVERICARVRDIDIVHRDPEQTRRLFSHQLPRNIKRQFVRTGKSARVRSEITNRELQDGLKLLKFYFTTDKRWRIERRLVIIVQQMFEISAAARACKPEQSLRQNDTRSLAWSKAPDITLTDSVKPIARSDYPCIRRRPLQLFSEVFKNGGVFWSDRSEVVESFVDACRQTRRGYVMTEDALICDMSEEARLRSHFAQHMRNVFLSLGRKGLLIARAPSEGYDNNLAFLSSRFRSHKRTRL